MDYEKLYNQLMQKKRGYDATYRERHKDEIRERFKQWYQNNKAQLSQRRKEQRVQEKATVLASDNCSE